MFKLARTMLTTVAIAGSLIVAAPASAGTAIFYYYDYPGGTPAGYEIWCDTGQPYYFWGERTGIFYVGPYVFC